MLNPLITRRKATRDDAAQLYEIWTHENVSPFTLFEPTISREEFEGIFSNMLTSRDLYVLAHNYTILAVFGIMKGKGNKSHIAEGCSLAVNQNQNARLGQVCYDHLLRLAAQSANIIQYQETDNPRTQRLARENGFTVLLTYSDMMRRKFGREEYLNRWYVGNSLWGRFSKDQANSISIPLISPIVSSPQEMDDTDNTEPCISISIGGYPGRLEHVLMVSCDVISLSHSEDTLALMMRKFILAQQHKYKQIAFHVSDQCMVNALAKLGAHIRGIIPYGVKKNDQYHDEMVLEVSFRGLDDAIELLDLCVKNERQKEKLQSAITQWCSHVEHTIKDELQAIFYKNLGYQWVRETFGDEFVQCYGHKGMPPSPPWESNPSLIPEALKNEFANLQRAPNMPARPRL